ncbi:Protein ElaA [Flavobacterium sp. 9AF]|uniref:GNAT family N-acetyltransferase n=1 Tax=Flavobacterium sp. 9AF TaxID=2653142 RepID=UPI0012F02167|nr:GNAT family N-acetyltransferase [Flavobacterium sp. 9AF]VXC25306.1 Protein ElaA [Flavobacterium sp. 9AF]
MNNSIQFKIKRFKELSLGELYDLLKLRSEVFVVEQNCVYLDIDGKDSKAIHVLGFYKEELVAYTRVFNKGDYFNEASIGRVVVHPDYRDKKWGFQLMETSIETVKVFFNQTEITISAQQYLTKFYESLGFIQTSDMYLEDDIPHVEMKKS